MRFLVIYLRVSFASSFYRTRSLALEMECADRSPCALRNLHRPDVVDREPSSPLVSPQARQPQAAVHF